MFEILARFTPNICWHPTRDTMAKAAFVIGLIIGNLEKTANEVFFLKKNIFVEITLSI